MVKASDLIIVGEVRSSEFVGKNIKASDDSGYSGEWHLVKVDVSVDLALRGKVTESSLEFFFYTSLGPVAGDWNSIQVGGRYVFFLKQDETVFRAVRDFWRSSIEVGSGKHVTMPKAFNTVEEQIAALLLIPGAGLDPARFQRCSFRSVQLAISWLGPCRTALLLKPLQTAASNEVRSTASDQLRAYRHKFADCPEVSPH